jgi:hypothetical protein
MKTETIETLEDIEVCPPEIQKDIDEEFSLSTPVDVVIVEEPALLPLSEEQMDVRCRMGVISMVRAIAAQAIDDYKSLSEAKLVRKNKIKKPWKIQPKMLNGDYRAESAVKELIQFFEGDGLEKCLDLAHARLHPDFVRRHIGFT